MSADQAQALDRTITGDERVQLNLSLDAAPLCRDRIDWIDLAEQLAFREYRNANGLLRGIRTLELDRSSATAFQAPGATPSPIITQSQIGLCPLLITSRRRLMAIRNLRSSSKDRHKVSHVLRASGSWRRSSGS